MKLCHKCYQQKGLPPGGGRKWWRSLHKKDKWGKSLKERESCEECGKDTGLITDTTKKWKEATQKKFWRMPKTVIKAKSAVKPKTTDIERKMQMYYKMYSK